MIGWTILAVSLLLIIFLRIVAGKFMPRPDKSKWAVTVLVILLVGGGYLVVTSADQMKEAFKRRDWPTAKGRVIKSEAVVKSIIYPMVVYAYEANGRAYVDTTDMQVPGFGNRNKQFEVTHAIIADYIVGKEITVHYDPTDNTNSVIVTSPRWNIFGEIGLGVLLFAGALFFLILPRPAIVVRKL